MSFHPNYGSLFSKRLATIQGVPFQSQPHGDERVQYYEEGIHPQLFRTYPGL